MIWIQESVELPPFPRGLHLITDAVVRSCPGLRQIESGLAHIFIQHTSASLTINENADADVPSDMESSLNRIVPESGPFRHTLEGPDDMPAHVKASLLGSSVVIPIQNGRLALGTWQGVFLCEHRNRAGRRRLVVTAWGAPTSPA